MSFGWTNFVKEAHREWGCRGEYLETDSSIFLIESNEKRNKLLVLETYHIVQTDGPSLKEDLSGPAGIYGEPQFDHVEANIFVERI